MTNVDESSGRQPRIGKGMTYGGVVIFATSLILGFAGIGGASTHNLLQGVGIGLLLLGYVVWKLFKI